MYTHKQIAKETASTALWVFYLNPIAFVVSSLLWASIVMAAIHRETAFVVVALVFNGVAWFAAYRMARSDLQQSIPQ